MSMSNQGNFKDELNPFIQNLSQMDSECNQDLFEKLVNSTFPNEYDKEQFLVDDQNQMSQIYLVNLIPSTYTFFSEQPRQTVYPNQGDQINQKIHSTHNVKMNGENTDESEQRPTKKNNYPTKNFLAKFKNALLDYLKKNLGKDYQKYPLLNSLKKKSYLSMKDYQAIFTEKDFSDILHKMFKQKIFYRALVISNTEMSSKKHFIKKIQVFEEAFETGNFSKIN